MSQELTIFLAWESGDRSSSIFWGEDRQLDFFCGQDLSCYSHFLPSFVLRIFSLDRPTHTTIQAKWTMSLQLKSSFLTRSKDQLLNASIWSWNRIPSKAAFGCFWVLSASYFSWLCLLLTDLWYLSASQTYSWCSLIAFSAQNFQSALNPVLYAVFEPIIWMRLLLWVPFDISWQTLPQIPEYLLSLWLSFRRFSFFCGSSWQCHIFTFQNEAALHYKISFGFFCEWLKSAKFRYWDAYRRHASFDVLPEYNSFYSITVRETTTALLNWAFLEDRSNLYKQRCTVDQSVNFIG